MAHVPIPTSAFSGAAVIRTRLLDQHKSGNCRSGGGSAILAAGFSPLFVIVLFGSQVAMLGFIARLVPARPITKHFRAAIYRGA